MHTHVHTNTQVHTYMVESEVTPVVPQPVPPTTGPVRGVQGRVIPARVWREGSIDVTSEWVLKNEQNWAGEIAQLVKMFAM